MNWYDRTILSQVLETTGIETYLYSLGASEDIIKYIISLDQQNSQILTNEFRKNPSLTLLDLQNFQIKKKVDPYLASEKRIAANSEIERLPQFSRWILVSLRKLRKGVTPPNEDMRELSRMIGSGEALHYQAFLSIISEIRDWVINMNVDISSYSPDQAMLASDEWHKMMAGKGEGKVYEPTKPESIAYGPEWKNEEYQGWTIQKVMSENDLLAEGNKMNHCVGSYWKDVKDGDIIIYSLRDPINKPHVTMETDGEGKIVKQIRGQSNFEPEDEHQSMLEEWINNSKTAPYTYKSDESSIWDIYYSDNPIESATEVLSYLIDGGNEYYEEDNQYNQYLFQNIGLEAENDNYGEDIGKFNPQEILQDILNYISYEYSDIPYEPNSNELDVDDFANIFVMAVTELKEIAEPEITKILYKIINTYDLNEGQDDMLKERLNESNILKWQKEFATVVLDRFIEKAPHSEQKQQYFDFSKSSNWYSRTISS